MEDKRNAYEIIGTNRDAVYMRTTDQARDEFIIGKVKDTKRGISKKIERLEERIKITEGHEKQKLIRLKQKLQIEMNLVDRACLQIRNSEQRAQYDAALDARVENFKHEIQKERKVTEDAYRILFTSRKNCNDNFSNSKKIDDFLFKMHSGLIKNKTDELELLKGRQSRLEKDTSSKGFREKSGLEADIEQIEKEIKRIDKLYEKIKNREARTLYDEELEEIQKQEDERIRQGILRKKYSVEKYSQTDTIQQIGYKPLEKAARESTIRTLTRKDGTILVIEQIGRLGYRNVRNMTGMIDAYRITRTVDGEKKWDVRYTNLNMIDLSRNPKTGKIENKDYYDFVANIFLSEDSIEGTKYNGGYLGEVIKDKDGKYFHDLNDINELSAVMKLNTIQKEKDREGKDIKEGEAYEQ